MRPARQKIGYDVAAARRPPDSRRRNASTKTARARLVRVEWVQYGAGYPNLHLVQRALQVLLVIGAIAVYFLPRRKTARQLAALTAALLLGFELVLTHWFYLYLPWFFPFAAYALLAPSPSPAPAVEPLPESGDRERRELVPAG